MPSRQVLRVSGRDVLSIIGTRNTSWDYFVVRVNGTEVMPRVAGFVNWDPGNPGDDRTISLSAYDDQTVTIEFLFKSDYSNSTYTEAGLFVDDVRVLGTRNLPNLRPYTPSGWDYPVVPSRVSGTHSVDTLYGNRPTYVDWAVLNDSSVAISGSFQTSLYIDGVLITSWTKIGLSTNSYAYIEDHVRTLPAGTHTLRLVADSGGNVNEANENDNVFERQFVWVNATPTVAASDIVDEPDGRVIYPMQTLSVKTTYRDLNGGSDLRYCWLRLRHNGRELNPGVTFLWDQSTGSFTPWAGDDGANWALLDGVSPTDVGDGYELTWSFRLREAWPPSTDVDFGIACQDDAGLASGWVYDDTNAIMLAKSGTINSVTPSTGPAGATTTLQVNVTNTGRDDSNLIVDYDPDTVPAGWSISSSQQFSVTYNTSANFSFTITPSASGGSGNITWRLYWDEPWPTANTLLQTRTVTFSAVRPNLRPYAPPGWDYPVVPSRVSGTHSVDTLYGNRPTYVDWAVLNDSSVAISGAFQTSLYIDGVLVTSWTKSGLSTNSYAYIEDHVQTLPAGTHTLRLVADSGGNVNEANENDNVFERQFVWVNATPTVAASDIVDEPDGRVIYPMQTLGVKATYRDQNGGSDLRYCWLRLRHDGRGLNPGITFLWDQNTGAFTPWTGDDGANWALLDAVSATDVGDGYELTWSFRIRETWPPSTDVDFGISCQDDAGLATGWVYDDTNAIVLAKSGTINSVTPAMGPAGAATTVQVNVTNTGRDDANLIVDYDPATVPSGWSISPSSRQFFVPYNTSAGFSFTVTPSANGGSANITWQLYWDDTWPAPNTLLASRVATFATPRFLDVRATGAWHYEDRPYGTSGFYMPAGGLPRKTVRRVTVQVLNGQDQVLGESVTGEDGSYTIPISGVQEGTPLRVRVLSQSEAVVVCSDAGLLTNTMYGYVTQPVAVTGAGDLPFGTLVLPASGNAGAWNILDVIQAGYQYALGHRAQGQTDPIVQVRVEWVRGRTVRTEYGPGSRLITVNSGSAADEYSDHALLHEYAHHLSSTISTGDRFLYESEHYFDREISGIGDPEEMAWLEGFADYFAVMVPEEVRGIVSSTARKGLYVDPIEGAITVPSDLEAGSDGSRNTRVEGSIASVLWDLYDTDADQGDDWNTGDGGARIFGIFDANLDGRLDAPSLRDFDTAWGMQGHVALERILRTHGVFPHHRLHEAHVDDGTYLHNLTDQGIPSWLDNESNGMSRELSLLWPRFTFHFDAGSRRFTMNYEAVAGTTAVFVDPSRTSRYRESGETVSETNWWAVKYPRDYDPRIQKPILFVHGLGTEPFGPIGYWASIPGALAGRVDAAGDRAYSQTWEFFCPPRESAAQRAEWLAAAIRYVLAQYPAGTNVTIVCHSMGGTITRMLLEDQPRSFPEADRISKVLFLAPVNHGAHQALRILAGEGDPAWYDPLFDWLYDAHNLQPREPALRDISTGNSLFRQLHEWTAIQENRQRFLTRLGSYSAVIAGTRRRMYADQLSLDFVEGAFTAPASGHDSQADGYVSAASCSLLEYGVPLYLADAHHGSFVAYGTWSSDHVATLVKDWIDGQINRQGWLTSSANAPGLMGNITLHPHPNSTWTAQGFRLMDENGYFAPGVITRTTTKAGVVPPFEGLMPNCFYFHENGNGLSLRPGVYVLCDENGRRMQAPVMTVVPGQTSEIDLPEVLKLYDGIAPSTVSDLRTAGRTSSSLSLSWTAPGDDGASGAASQYDLRYSTTGPITSSNWSSARQVSGEPAPAVAGTTQSMTVTGLVSSTGYWFGLVASDDVGNPSGISNSPSATTAAPPDTLNLTGPAGPTSDTSATFRWTTSVAGYRSEVRREGGAWEDMGTATTKAYSNVADGQHSFEVRAIDPAGDPDPTPAVWTWVVDTTKPTVAITSPTSSGTWNTTSTPISIGGTDGDNLSVSGVTWARAAGGTGTATLTSGTTWGASVALAAGSNVITVRAYDAANNSSSTQITVNYTPPDATAPATVANLSVSGPTSNSITLFWTAPGDDGSTGTATQHDVRYSTTGAITASNWTSAVSVSGEPPPSAGGTTQGMTVPGLSPSTTYWFAMRTADEVLQWSGVSNSPTATTLSDVSATDPGLTNPTPDTSLPGAAVTFTWSAGTGFINIRLFVGSQLGGTDCFLSSYLRSSVRSVLATNLPTDGRQLYVRLSWTTNGSTYRTRDYTFTAYENVVRSWVLHPSEWAPGSGCEMAYDSARQRVVLFREGTTCEWDGTSWAQISPATSPSPRTGFGLVYDASRGRVVLFGGESSPGVYDGECWEWNGQTWRQVFSAAAPSPRARHAMAYDPARRVVVLFGGRDATGLKGDCWEWDGTTWAQRAPAAPPSARESHAMAYEASRGRVVLFGGRDATGLKADSWEWDGAGWTQRTTATAPAAREGHSMGSDPASGAGVLLFAGTTSAGPSNETWRWDGSTWSRMSVGVAPLARTDAAVACDTVRRSAVVFGGRTGSSILGDTWELRPVNADGPQVTSPAPGSAFTSTAVQIAWSRGTGVTAYRLRVGRTQGGGEWFDQDMLTNLSATVGGLPTDGSAVNVRLYWTTNGMDWLAQDYSYTSMR